MPSEQRMVADAMFKQAADNLQKEYNDRVATAIAASAQIPGDYWNCTLLRRIFGQEGQVGSFWMATGTEQVSEALANANWWPFPHKNVMPGCACFKAVLSLEGHEGVVDLRTVPPDTKVLLSDPKNTGEATAQIHGYAGRRVEHSCVILGLEEGKEVAFTVHPGDPAPYIGVPMDLVREKFGNDPTITAAQALEIGIESASIY